MKNCGTCIFWSDVLVVSNGKSDCGKVQSIIKDKNKTFEIKMSAADDSGLDGVLITGKDFGCIHHEPKQKENG